MPTTVHIAGLPPQLRPGVGARLLRRLGGAVCNAIAGGVALTSRLRRKATPPRTPAPQAARDPEAPPRPARSHRFARNRRQTASRRSRAFPDIDAPFTPEAYPGLSPEFCAFLHTPLEQCDPAMLRQVFAAFAQCLAEVLPSELGMTDAGDVFSALCGRLGTGFGETASATSPAEAANSAPAAATDAALVPSTDTEPDAASEPPPALPEAQPAQSADDIATAAIAALETTPDLTFLPGPVFTAAATDMAALLSRQQIVDPPPPAPIIVRAEARHDVSPTLPWSRFERVATGPPTGPPLDRDLQLCRA